MAGYCSCQFICLTFCTNISTFWTTTDGRQLQDFSTCRIWSHHFCRINLKSVSCRSDLPQFFFRKEPDHRETDRLANLVIIQYRTGELYVFSDFHFGNKQQFSQFDTISGFHSGNRRFSGNNSNHRYTQLSSEKEYAICICSERQHKL